ncbi:MAG: hypothetical protein P4L87_21215 [Formivibrio sp.]|nr:hypothetical protein [Formivibrio sp.]
MKTNTERSTTKSGMMTWCVIYRDHFTTKELPPATPEQIADLWPWLNKDGGQVPNVPDVRCEIRRHHSYCMIYFSKGEQLVAACPVTWGDSEHRSSLWKHAMKIQRGQEAKCDFPEPESSFWAAVFFTDALLDFQPEEAVEILTMAGLLAPTMPSFNALRN